MARIPEGARRLVRRLAPRRGASASGLFPLFFSGRHDEVVAHFTSSDSAQWSNNDLHLVVASMAILGEDVMEIAARLDPPLSPAAAGSTLEAQLLRESSADQIGILTQPSFVHKSLYAACIGLSAGKSNFVETGTYIGQSLFMISDMFNHLSTVEAKSDLFTASQALFTSRNVGNITGHVGDSRAFLRGIDPAYGNESVYFLDAHYSSGITSREFGACPVIEEIQTILARSPAALIVVDDMRLMTGQEGYPTLGAILSSLPASLHVELAYDQMVIHSREVAIRWT